MKKYEIFLFDADDTLYDYDMSEANALKTMLESIGISFDITLHKRYREINMQTWKRFEQGEISSEELQTSRFARLFDELGIHEDAKEFNASYLAEFGKGSFLIDGALDICKAITSQGKEIYIVTNGLVLSQEARVKHSPLVQYISDTFVSDRVGYQKPHPAYFDYVFKHIPQIGKDKFLIIGDSLTADIVGGNNAGIDTCWFNERRKENHTEITPTYEIHKLRELEKFI